MNSHLDCHRLFLFYQHSRISTKKGNSWRLIIDLSFPVEHSVIYGIDKDDFSFQNCTAKHAINLIIKTGKRAFMGKVDIKSAYRMIPVNPSDRYLLGMHWKRKYCVDVILRDGLLKELACNGKSHLLYDSIGSQRRVVNFNFSLSGCDLG